MPLVTDVLRLAVVVSLLLPAGVLAGLVENHSSPPVALASIALGISSSDDLEVLARAAGNQRRYDEAATYYRGARALSPRAPFYTFALAIALGDAGRCDEARSEYEHGRGLSAPLGTGTAPEVERSAARAVDWCADLGE